MKKKTKIYSSMMSLGLSSLILLSGCSGDNKSEEEVYGMNVEKLEEHAKEAATTPVTEEQKRVLDESESQNLEIGSFVDNMPDRKALEKVNKDFVSVMYFNSIDGTKTVSLAYSIEYMGNGQPYPRDFYANDGVTGEFWCTGYIIVEIKYEEKDGKTYKMVQIPEEFGSTNMIWYNAGEVNDKVSVLVYTNIPKL